MVATVEDFSALDWLWSDATLLSLRVDCLPDGYLTVILTCEVNAYEDRSLQIPYGAAAQIVNVILSKADNLSIREFARTGDQGVIVSWVSTKGADGRSETWMHHVIELNTGAVIEVASRRIEIAEVNAYP